MKAEEYITMFQNETTERLSISRERLKQLYEANSQIYKQAFVSCMEQLFHNGRRFQSKGEKGSIQYVCIHNLRASIRTGDFSYMIALYDKNFYFDRKETAVYWFPAYYHQVLKEDTEYFRQQLQKKCIRIPDCDIRIFCENYMGKLLSEVPEEVWDVEPQIYDMKAFKDMETEPSCMLYFGEYMEKVQAVC